jgi:hypothetical protein
MQYTEKDFVRVVVFNFTVAAVMVTLSALLKWYKVSVKDVRQLKSSLLTIVLIGTFLVVAAIAVAVSG